MDTPDEPDQQPVSFVGPGGKLTLNEPARLPAPTTGTHRPTSDVFPEPDVCGVNAINYGDADSPQCVCNAGAFMCGEKCLGASEQRIADLDQHARTEEQCLTAPNCYGQSFTPASSGWLTQLGFDGQSPGRQLLAIFSGAGQACAAEGVLLHEQAVDTSKAGWKRVLLTYPLEVKAGKTYTFQLRGLEYWRHGCSSEDIYKGGESLAMPGTDIAFEAVIATCP
jgi:hypothetical protein